MTTAHHLDIGSSQPGSVGVVVCSDSYAEGLRFRALKVYDQGRRNEALWRMIGDNVRVSDLVIGDMDAQVAACHVGARRLLDLIERYGLATLTNAIEDLFDNSERLMRSQIAKLKDGTYSATGYVDGFLGSDDPALKNLPIKIAVTVSGSDLTIDLTGTAQQVAGHAINMPFIGTVDVALWLTLRSILLDTEIFGNIPQNDGLYRPIKIVAPRGCIANPIFPAPTIARFAPGNVVADTLMRALATAVPEQVSAGIANLKAVTFTGFAGEQQWVHIEIFEGSYGGRFGKDGMDSVDTLYANTRNNPIEDIESHVPLRVTRYELREDSVAPGRWRGGLNAIKEVMFLTDGSISVEGDGHSHKPWGFQGGADGHTSQLQLIREGQQPIELPSMLPTIAVAKGDRIRAVGGIGGGYGKASERPPAMVIEDVLDGYLTRESAARDFGVVIDSDGKLEKAATQRR
jgi:N-methylhydantoinase B